ncbi:IS66 family insertion sequence element accessory protein TnpA [Clostridium thermarum]|uniref:IS66 family insertion sequence element accessory protein TnpA n=1 Tax=Clostridium thermarum TaxID=1716543 RepID=UPI00111E8886|nr:IS66 family insertion sequence element accessory protein TnpB [Clostridium thermarum]
MTKLNMEDWQQLIADYRSSGLTGPVWCQQKQLSIHKLRYWINKFNKAEFKEEPRQQWVSVKTNLSITTTSITVKVGKAEISVSQDFDKELFADVVQSLLTLC